MAIGLKVIQKMFKYGSVMVTGMRGRGKDVLFGNIIARDKRPYISNIDYGYERIPYQYKDIAIGSTYKDIINRTVKPYKYPYPENCDIYLSDGGIEYPSQYNGELNKEFKDIPLFMALSRQIALANVHANVQNYGRLWDKMREQCDQYIYCERCLWIGQYVIQSVIVYDKAESCQNRVQPCRIKVPIFGGKEARMNAKIYIDKFLNQNGSVARKLLIYKNKSKHDTRYFKKLFEKGGNGI